MGSQKHCVCMFKNVKYWRYNDPANKPPPHIQVAIVPLNQAITVYFVDAV